MALYKQNLRGLRRLIQARSTGSNASDNEGLPTFVNRNPRNLERLRIAYKPDGYYVDAPGKCFWHKLQLIQSDRYATAVVVHFQNGTILQASTKEWAIKKQLYQTADVSAYINLARVFAQRCLESGLTELCCNVTPPNDDGKVANFLRVIEETGIRLEEPAQYKAPYPWTRERPEKPWEIVD